MSLVKRVWEWGAGGGEYLDLLAKAVQGLRRILLWYMRRGAFWHHFDGKFCMRMKVSCYIACGMEIADLVRTSGGIDALVMTSLRWDLILECDGVISW